MAASFGCCTSCTHVCGTDIPECPERGKAGCICWKLLTMLEITALSRHFPERSLLLQRPIRIMVGIKKINQLLLPFLLQGCSVAKVHTKVLGPFCITP